MEEYFITENRNRHSILELKLRIDNTAQAECSKILEDSLNKFSVKTVSYVSKSDVDVAIVNTGNQTVDILETPCALQGYFKNSFSFGIESDPKR